jgi:hypothetical protein
MLKLVFTPTPSGAPDSYGDARDHLSLRTDQGDAALQDFAKADPDLVPPSKALASAIDDWLQRRGATDQPVVVMVHGYLYDPMNTREPGDSPFDLIYGTPPKTIYRATWLPLVGECKQDGSDPAENAIAFTYKSEAGVTEFASAGWSNSYQYAVFDLARLAARPLAATLAHLGTKGSALTVRVLAHSLGTRTTGLALRLLGAGIPANLDRVILLDGAEFCVDAAAAFAGCRFDVLNFVNRKDAVLRIGAEQACHPMRPNGDLTACVIGREGLGGNDRWLDLQLDSNALAAWFRAGRAPTGIAYAIAPLAEEASYPAASLDHWSCYTNDGNRRLVTDLLFSPLMTIDRLRANQVPAGTDAPSYGRFNNVPVPPTLDSAARRRYVIAQASASGSNA